MKEKYKKILKIIIIVLFGLSLFYALTNYQVLADVGNNNNYEQTDTTSSGDDSDIFFLIYILFDMFGPFGALIILAIIAIIYFFLKKTGALSKMRTNNQNAIDLERANMSESYNGKEMSKAIADKIRVDDPKFSEDAFIGWAREVFMKIQQAWNDRDWKVIRPFESETLFNQHNQQLNEYINNNKINKIEKIAIRYCGLKSYHVDGDKEVLIVELHATMRDYVVDATTDEVLESDPNRNWFMKYDMTFNRKKGVLTKEGMSNKSTTNCPNCGAPTEITSSGQCEYCKSIITTGEHDWVLSNIVSIK